MEYQQIGAWRHRPAASTDVSLEGCPGTLAGMGCWVVFGTLLGPEATGPGTDHGFGCGVFAGLFVSGFQAAPSAHVSVWGVWFGVVV